MKARTQNAARRIQRRAPTRDELETADKLIVHATSDAGLTHASLETLSQLRCAVTRHPARDSGSSGSTCATATAGNALNVSMTMPWTLWQDEG